MTPRSWISWSVDEFRHHAPADKRELLEVGTNAVDFASAPLLEPADDVALGAPADNLLRLDDEVAGAGLVLFGEDIHVAA